MRLAARVRGAAFGCPGAYPGSLLKLRFLEEI